MLKLCGETQEKLAQELILFEFQIERDVVEPLYDLAEVWQGVKITATQEYDPEVRPGPLDYQPLKNTILRWDQGF